jgi:hypothetical protein
MAHGLPLVEKRVRRCDVRICSSKLLERTRQRAGLRLHQILDELQLLSTAFPDLRAAFDGDELPIAFILERDFRRSERGLPPYTGPPSVPQRPDHSTSSHASAAS